MNINWADLLTDEHETLDIFIAHAIGANKRAIAAACKCVAVYCFNKPLSDKECFGMSEVQINISFTSAS